MRKRTYSRTARLLSLLLLTAALLSTQTFLFAEDALAEEGSSQVADSSEMAQPQEVGDEDMVPVYGDGVEDGEYEIEVDSSSSMFRIVDAVLTVQGGEMSAVLTLSGKGYGKLFMGTGEEAAAAAEHQYIPYAENEEGAYTYEVPVEALDKKIPCAAWSLRKEKWYDRDLVFLAESLPQGALKEGAGGNAGGSEKSAGETGSSEGGDSSAKGGEAGSSGAVHTDAADGVYRLNIQLGGGSGKATIASPAEVTVRDGFVWAKIEWSSSNYDYMIVEGQRYEPVNGEGNSVFEIPVPVLDEAFEVKADTTAMSVPHEIEYTLTVDSSGLVDAEGIPAVWIVVIAAVVLAALIAGIFAGRRIRAGKSR